MTHHEAVDQALTALVRVYGEDQVCFAAEGWIDRQRRRVTGKTQYPKHTHGRLPNQPESPLKTGFYERSSETEEGAK